MTTFWVRQARSEDRDHCVAVLQLLPDYFTPNTHDELREQFSPGDAWVAVGGDDGATVIGFVSVERRFETTAEITFAAVRREHHGTGVGTALVDRALAALAERGVAIVEVKTLDASAGYAPYDATRAFWRRRGFHQIDRIQPLPGWDPISPAAICVCALATTR